jgi:hypothetical protein
MTSRADPYLEKAAHLESRAEEVKDPDAPLRRAVQPCGTIAATPILSGLHHHYRRI